jgi:hypothetical protein
VAKKAVPKKKICASCGKGKLETSFYATTSKMYPDKRLSICKTCLSDMVDVSSVESVKDVLRQIDKPFIASLWRSCVEEYPDNPFGNFMRCIGSLQQYKGWTWDNSSFGEDDKIVGTSVETEKKSSKKSTSSTVTNQNEIPLELYDKWGFEFTPKEIIAFEALYNDLKNNYKLPTASHVEFLKLACISRVKATNAMARGDTKEARDYMAIFKDMTSAGKLQPAQFSKADLSEGLDTFGQLVRRVEMSESPIPILPQFREQPKDKVDIVIWAYANYSRSIKGLEEASYEEIYKWYDKRKEDFESSINKNNEGESDS